MMAVCRATVMCPLSNPDALDAQLLEELRQPAHAAADAVDAKVGRLQGSLLRVAEVRRQHGGVAADYEESRRARKAGQVSPVLRR